MEAKTLRLSIQEMYSQLNYEQFCKYMGFNPKYDERYWAEFKRLSDAVSVWDDANLQKILDFAKDKLK